MKTFYIEVTDTFGGEANYSWVKRHAVTAKSERGAIQKLARHSGMRWRVDCDYGDMIRYNARGACVCAFVELWDSMRHKDLHFTAI